MKFINNIYEIHAGGDVNYFRGRVGQKFQNNELEIIEIVHDRNHLKDYGINRYYVVVKSEEGEIFTWKVFEDCEVKLTLSK